MGQVVGGLRAALLPRTLGLLSTEQGHPRDIRLDHASEDQVGARAIEVVIPCRPVPARREGLARQHFSNEGGRKCCF